MPTPKEDHMSKISIIESGCWEWQGNIMPTGYGKFRGKPAHRVVYELEVRKLEKDEFCHHTCENRKCVNPDHIEIVSRLEHEKLHTKHNSKKVYCKRGHKLEGDNIIWNGHWRLCRACHNMHQSRYYYEGRTYMKGVRK